MITQRRCFQPLASRGSDSLAGTNSLYFGRFRAPHSRQTPHSSLPYCCCGFQHWQQYHSPPRPRQGIYLLFHDQAHLSAALRRTYSARTASSLAVLLSAATCAELECPSALVPSRSADSTIVCSSSAVHLPHGGRCMVNGHRCSACWRPRLLLLTPSPILHTDVDAEARLFESNGIGYCFRLSDDAQHYYHSMLQQLNSHLFDSTTRHHDHHDDAQIRHIQRSAANKRAGDT